MSQYPALPTLDPIRTPETLQGYGLRVLAFVMAHGCTATLTDADLKLADHVYPVAISAPDILPIAVDRLTVARHLILRSLATRAAESASTQPVESIPPANGSLLPGRAVPLQPAPINRPPAGATALIGNF